MDKDKIHEIALDFWDKGISILKEAAKHKNAEFINTIYLVKNKEEFPDELLKSDNALTVGDLDTSNFVIMPFPFMYTSKEEQGTILKLVKMMSKAFDSDMCIIVADAYVTKITKEEKEEGRVVVSPSQDPERQEALTLSYEAKCGDSIVRGSAISPYWTLDGNLLIDKDDCDWMHDLSGDTTDSIFFNIINLGENNGN